MFNFRLLLRIDFRICFVVLCLMVLSLLVISSMTSNGQDSMITFCVRKQMHYFFLGWILFFFLASFDYRKLREWTWILYLGMILLLLGLYFASPIQNVRRWYRIPFIGINLQPSEIAKLVVVISLAWILERSANRTHLMRTTFQVASIVGLPFLLILKQPDLGTAFILYPITLAMGFFGGLNKWFLKILSTLGGVSLILVTLFQFGVLSHEKMRPVFTTVLKEYQYDRLKSNTYHQKASQTAIAIGGIWGSGWGKSQFSSRKWLPAAHTDSIFPAFGEEFGLVGMIFLLLLYYILIYCSFQVIFFARDSFGRLLACGLAVYFTMHILINIGMMCGFIPITGVPLLLMTYGGSSVLTTMAALGILQSIYNRRFMF